MLDSVPVPLQAVFWPLLGAAIILAANRLLPQWLGCLIASAAAVASFAVLWSLRNLETTRLEFTWEPLGLFRTSPALYPDGLALFGGLALTTITAALVLGIRSPGAHKATRHGLLLVVLAGGLITTMGTNLPTLAIGSALIDLALITMAVTRESPGSRSDGPILGMIATGALSTLILAFSGFHLSAQVGTTSLLAPDLPAEVFLMVAVAGMLRLRIYPLHPRRTNTAMDAATALLLTGVGIQLIARSQAIEPILEGQPWTLALGSVALLAGGLLAWAAVPSLKLRVSEPVDSLPAPPETAGERGETIPHHWLGILVNQAGVALVFLYLLGPAVPWPLLSLTLALGILVIWSDASPKGNVGPHPRWFEQAAQQVQAGWVQVRSRLAERIPALEHWEGSRFHGKSAILLPAIALASLAGLPLTVGAIARWSLYGAVLKDGHGTLLLALLVADTFLAAALGIALVATWPQIQERRPRALSLVAMLALAFVMFVAGIAPGGLYESLGLDPIRPSGVSIWGLGLVYVLPWALSIPLARARTHLTGYLPLVWKIVNLDWFYRAASWLGRRVSGAVYWLGLVGEGDGWLGWALIIMALGAVLLAAR